MGILIYNRYGLWMFVAGIGVFTVTILATAAFGWGMLAIYLTGFLWIVLDLRLRRRNGNGWFYPRAGGHVWFVPIWFLGLAVVAGGVMLQRELAAAERAGLAADQKFNQRLQELRRHIATRPTEASIPDITH